MLFRSVMLYDADRVEAAASVTDESKLYESQLDLFLDPNDPEVIAAARAANIPEDWIEHAQRSPIYKMVVDWKIALPLHPEYRTLPMVWYVPPLSPITNMVEGKGAVASPEDVFPAIDDMRIPVQYLANLLSAGDTKVIENVLKKMAVMRSHMRSRNLNQTPDLDMLERFGMTEKDRKSVV